MVALYAVLFFVWPRNFYVNKPHIDHVKIMKAEGSNNL